MVINLDECRLCFVIERQNEFTTLLPATASVGILSFDDASFAT